MNSWWSKLRPQAHGAEKRRHAPDALDEAEAERRIEHAILMSIRASSAIIEFDCTGIILSANDNFLKATGYKAEEIIGQHHRIFMDPADRDKPAYLAFWAALGRGEHCSGEFFRRRKDGSPLWIQASYSAVLDDSGKPNRIVKIAADITAEKERAVAAAARLEVIDRSHAVIEFKLDGTIVTANENFLQATGYRLDEIEGKHHRMFVDATEAFSPAYATFWQQLAEGEIRSGEFRRVRKDGRPIWLQASYNLLTDANGEPKGVIKHASDITAEVEARQARQLMDALAASVEELSVSMRQIGGDMNQSRDATERTFALVTAANDASDKAAGAATAMDSTIEAIKSITDKTNLLALNATIQAARAGDSGRGFAVVAAEIKRLAGQAAEASVAITAEIDNLRAVSTGAVEAIAGIDQAIRQIQSHVSATSAAVEEQISVTTKMAKQLNGNVAV